MPGSLKPPSINLINRQIICFNCSLHSVVPTKNFALTRPATPTPACIGIASSRVPSAFAVTPSAPTCVDEPLQSLGTAPATTAPAPAHATLPDSATLSPASEAAAVPCPASPCAESNIASLGPARAPTAPDLTSSHLESDPLLAVAMSIASDIQHAPCLNCFLTGKQHPTLPPPHQPPKIIRRRRC